MIDKNKGKLYIVGTPIGNLDDITIRAVNTLRNVDVILAEDTRQTLKLLNHFEISKHMISYHRHNEDDKIEKIVEILNSGKNLALVSDAGMPIISDPGQNLVKYLVKNNYDIEVVPGVTALITAIVKSGLDSTRFTFEGFLSVNKKQRKERLKSLVNETRTMIFYEAPHRIMKTLNMMLEVFGDRDISISREITKKFETVYRGKLSDVIRNVSEKGEFVIVVSGCEEKVIDDNLSIKEAANLYIKAGLDVMTAIKKVAKDRKIPKNEIYKEYHKEEK